MVQTKWITVRKPLSGEHTVYLECGCEIAVDPEQALQTCEHGNELRIRQ